VDDAIELWTQCAGHVRGQVTDATWRPWFAAIEAVSFDGSTLVLSVPSSVVRDRLEERYLGLLEGSAGDAAGHPVRVTVHMRTSAAPLPEDRRPDERPPEADDREQAHLSPLGSSGRRTTTGTNSYGASVRTAPESPPLNPRYTFDMFVIGASNRFAHAAAQRVAETPAASYNPLFIHGDSGLGKTHLLHAIGHYVTENFASRRVRYVSCETFMNDFVEAIRNSNQSTFKKRYRDCDVLLVDDIQFMEGKEGLQEEFFHTFNSLYEGAKQIVLSSDRHPRSIATLEDRLRSRFEWGLTTDVQPPELETRLAILRKKAESEPTPVPDDVLELIATNVRDNIRELEGALIRVTAFASLNRETLTRATAELILADILDAGRPRQITPQLIVESTATAFGFSIEELTGPKRQRPLVRARQIGMYAFRELTEYSYPAIGREFGGRDHTTVIHAFEKISALMKSDRRTYDQVTDLIYSIKGGTSSTGWGPSTG
jgi:chromosomal replication initiator protein